MLVNDINSAQYLDCSLSKNELLAYLSTLDSDKTISALMLELVDCDKWLLMYNSSVASIAKTKITSTVSNIFSKNANFFHIFDDTFLIIFENIDINKVIEFSYTIRMVFIDNDVDVDLSLFAGITYGNVNNIISKAFTALKYSKRVLSKLYFLDIADSEFDERMRESIDLRKTIKHAILNNKIIPSYQPIYDNKLCRITKYECLARVVDGDRVIYPNSFVKIAREMGCMRRITFSIIDNSFNEFQNNGYEFSINITEEDLQDKQMIEYLKYNCQKYNIAPSRIIIELLEDIEFGDDNIILNNILYLKELGFKIAIDDFGYANSNFGRLIKMSVDYLKIDGSFIRNLSDDLISQKIVSSITSFAKSANILCIAEHVHNEEIHKIVNEIGIEYSQGYYIGKAEFNLLED